MNPLSWSRHHAVNYHFEEGKAWLKESKRGKRCTALSYAAFEFRLAIERIIFQYWYTINNNELKEDNIKDVRSFKRMQNKIYTLGGVQKTINKHFEFVQILLDSLQTGDKLIPPDLGKLHKSWDTCSELCHITWTIAPKDLKLKRNIFYELEEIHNLLSSYTSGLTSWPQVVDENLKKVQHQFIDGEISENDVRKYLSEIGLWALQTDHNNKRKFVGEPIEPNKI